MFVTGTIVAGNGVLRRGRDFDTRVKLQLVVVQAVPFRTLLEERVTLLFGNVTERDRDIT